MSHKKINWILILQGWTMLWVILGHSFLGKPGEGPIWENTIFRIAYSFHMPLFMWISGYLFYLTRIRKRVEDIGGGMSYAGIIKDKVIRLLLPFVVFTIVALLIKIAFPGEISRQIHNPIETLLTSFLYPYDNPMREMWFIATLFWMFLLLPLWELSLRNNSSIILTTLILLFLHKFHPETELFCIGRVFSYAIYFYLGLVISRLRLIEKITIRNYFNLLIVGGIIYIIGLFYNSFLASIGGIIISISLSIIFDNYYPSIFLSFRDYTYQIFLIGIFAQMLVKIVYRRIDMPYLVGFIVCVICGIYVPVIISKLLKKTNIKFLLYAVGIK